jgi:hypothetical protein
MPVISALGKLRQKDPEFEVSLCYILKKMCRQNISPSFPLSVPSLYEQKADLTMRICSTEVVKGSFL